MIALGAKVINNSAHDLGADERNDFGRKIRDARLRAKNEFQLPPRLDFFRALYRDLFPLARVQSGTRAVEGRR